MGFMAREQHNPTQGCCCACDSKLWGEVGVRRVEDYDSEHGVDGAIPSFFGHWKDCRYTKPRWYRSLVLQIRRIAYEIIKDPHAFRSKCPFMLTWGSFSGSYFVVSPWPGSGLKHRY
jgi:hypothetical protein